MKHNTILTISLLAAALTTSLAYADTVATFTAEQKGKIEEIIRDYITKDHPEVLIKASQALQAKQQARMQKQAKSAIAQNGDALVRGTWTVAGNPRGDVTLVEFFDYQCGHCKKMAPVIHEVIKKNPNLRVVYKEFPIFGKESDMASRLAIVAAMHGKYTKAQHALFKAEHIDEKTIEAIAKKIGLNSATLKTDMDSKTVTHVLEESRTLAEKIHLMGTPAFVILSTPNGQFKAGSETAFVPGAASEETIQELISKFTKK